MSLRWEAVGRSGGQFGYSGEIVIATVGALEREPGRYFWRVTGVDVRVAASHGERKSLGAARRAADAAWSRWLEAVRLRPMICE